MDSNWEMYIHTLERLKSWDSTRYYELVNTLHPYASLALKSDLQNRFVEPMPWIGMYIALASLVCVLAMVADLLHGFRNRKLWFPCKFFTLNAAALTIIAVAMKLPVDLSTLMSGVLDHFAKVGSMAFMCTMMANLLPSLAIMGNKELWVNIIALGILVITLVVNVCIQINTGLVSYGDLYYIYLDESLPKPGNLADYPSWPETLYVALLLMLLMIHMSSSLAILKSKQTLESQYQACHKLASKDHKLQQIETSNVEMLTQHIRNYWIMAATGSPQFMIACFATTAASGVICALSSVLHIYIMTHIIRELNDCKSDYKWSVIVILFTQFCGVVLGSVAPFSRCLASLSYELSMKCFCNHIKVFKVESYWTQKLADWKRISIPFPIHSRILKIVIQNLKVLILNICIGFQKSVVVVCKMIGLVSIFFLIGFLYCFRCCWKWLKSMFIVLGEGPEQPEQQKDLRRYVLYLQDDMKLAERTLKCILKSVNQLIRNGEKQHPKNLMKLLEKSRGFKGVEMLKCHHVPPLLAEEIVDCWSLPLVTLTTIAISLPNIPKNIVNWLLRSMSEGLVYVMLVEETLNASDRYENIQKAAKTLWLEVEVYHRWLGTKLQQTTSELNTTGQILRWFRDKAKNIVTAVKSTDIGGQENDSIFMSIPAYAMYHITETILLSYREDIDQVSQEELFEHLSSMISDILSACLTNLPQVIAIKCHATAIEKREASVQAAAQLLGETTQIINHVQDRAFPSLKPDDLAFIDKWCDILKHPFP